jgi:hypothetical protein
MMFPIAERSTGRRQDSLLVTDSVPLWAASMEGHLADSVPPDAFHFFRRHQTTDLISLGRISALGDSPEYSNIMKLILKPFAKPGLTFNNGF